MGLFDRLSEGVVKGLSQTERALEVGRLKSQIAALVSQRDEAIMGLGRAVYRAYREDRFSDSAYDAALEQIRELEISLGRLDGEIEALRVQGSGRRCDACGASNAVDAKYCAGCGAEIVAVETQSCPSCGAVCNMDVSFCGRCGTELEPGESSLDTSDPAAVEATRDSLEAMNQEASVAPESQSGLACPSCGHQGEPGERFCGACGWSSEQ